MLFFQVLLSLIFTVYKGHIQLMYWGSMYSTAFFRKVENIVSVFCLKSSNCFPLKTHVFGTSFVFCIMMVFKFSLARDRPASVTDFVMTSQDNIKVYFLLFTRAIFIYWLQGPGVPLGFFEWSRIMFLSFFFLWNHQIVFPSNPMLSECPWFFSILYVMIGVRYWPWTW